MGWRSIHWHRSELHQNTRFERYADDSWMLLLSPFGRVYVAFKGKRKRSPARYFHVNGEHERTGSGT